MVSETDIQLPTLSVVSGGRIGEAAALEHSLQIHPEGDPQIDAAGASQVCEALQSGAVPQGVPTFLIPCVLKISRVEKG